MQTNWYAIVGGVCSGKTSVIEELKKRGYTVVPEAARAIIDEDLAEGKTIDEIRGDVLTFQRRILKRFEEVEKQFSPSDVVFFDRGRPDARAFLAFNKIPEPTDVTQLVEEARYKKVFMLAPLTLVTDYYRIEHPEEIAILHTAHVDAYKTMPFPIVDVPVMSVGARATFIENNLT